MMSDTQKRTVLTIKYTMRAREIGINGGVIPMIGTSYTNIKQEKRTRKSQFNGYNQSLKSFFKN